MKRIIGSLVLAMALAACGSDSKKSSTPATKSPTTNTDTATSGTTTGDAALGKTVYTTYCSMCHGTTGQNTGFGDIRSATEAKIATCTGSGCTGSAGGTMVAVTLTSTQLANVKAYVTEKLSIGEP